MAADKGQKNATQRMHTMYMHARRPGCPQLLVRAQYVCFQIVSSCTLHPAPRRRTSLVVLCTPPSSISSTAFFTASQPYTAGQMLRASSSNSAGPRAAISRSCCSAASLYPSSTFSGASSSSGRMLMMPSRSLEDCDRSVRQEVEVHRDSREEQVVRQVVGGSRPAGVGGKEGAGVCSVQVNRAVSTIAATAEHCHVIRLFPVTFCVKPGHATAAPAAYARCLLLQGPASWP